MRKDTCRYLINGFSSLVDRQVHKYSPEQERESLVQNVCNGKLKGNTNDKYNISVNYRQPSCHFLHHLNSYNRLGPFHIEVKFYYPMRILFHDFLYDEEMEWMQETSKVPLKSTMLWLTSNDITSSEQILEQQAQSRHIRVLQYGGKIAQVRPCHLIDDIEYYENDNDTVELDSDTIVKNMSLIHI